MAIVKVSLENELDVVLAFKKARQLAETAGLSFADQTKFCTAVSEISRNALVHAGKGKVELDVTNRGTSFFIEATVIDQGPGIHNLKELLARINNKYEVKPTGLKNCCILCDVFEIECPEAGGTCVKVGRRLPDNHPPINRLILSGWRKHFNQSFAVSPYDELKRQNQHLILALDDLNTEKKHTYKQLEEINSLNSILKDNYEKIKVLSQSVENQNKLLRKRNEDLDEFAYVISHDLKAPVANLEGLVEILETVSSADQIKVKSLIAIQIKKIKEFISGILAYSRTGYDKVQKDKIDMNLLISEIFGDLRKPDNFELEIRDKLPILITEKIFVTQIFTNLFSNSIKYNDKQTGEIIVGSVRTGDDENLFWMEDNGPGIPHSKMEAIFTMFTVLHQHEGIIDSSGVGLPIIRKIINEKGGEIWVEEAKNFDTGSRFCFTWRADELIS